MKAKTGHPTKKRNPQDSTRRNVQAANKRLTTLEQQMSAVLSRLRVLEGSKEFAASQRALGYRHSTSFPASIRVKG